MQVGVPGGTGYGCGVGTGRSEMLAASGSHGIAPAGVEDALSWWNGPQAVAAISRTIANINRRVLGRVMGRVIGRVIDC